jgi:predicted Ser/Thr protein kinase
LSRPIRPIAIQEQLSRSVGEEIDISRGRKDDFRREVMNFISTFRPNEKAGANRSSDHNNVACRLSPFLTPPP